MSDRDRAVRELLASAVEYMRRETRASVLPALVVRVLRMTIEDAYDAGQAAERNLVVEFLRKEAMDAAELSDRTTASWAIGDRAIAIERGAHVERARKL